MPEGVVPDRGGVRGVRAEDNPLQDGAVDEGLRAHGVDFHVIDSVAIGGGATYYILPSEGYTIDKVYRNGVEVDESLITIEEDEDNGIIVSVFVDDVQEPTVLTCTFKILGIYDPEAANVRMKLQPNPATSNVFITLKGVTGMVDMALIDMSGRVVNTSRFNAENGASINVSNLAKGAYFVRITNDKFSKVVKLIVR